MRKIFNFFSKLCICLGLLIALINIGGPPLSSSWHQLEQLYYMEYFLVDYFGA